MFESFSFLAEEISRTIAMVWGGVVIATDLNYRLMTVIITSTTRMVQLLFLLTKKVTDVLSIIAGDILLFIGDVGNGTVAFFNLFHNFALAVLSFIAAIFSGLVNSLCYLYQQFCSLFNTLFCLLSACEIILYSAVILIRDIIILFGYSIIFIITFIPKMIYLLMRESVYSIHHMHASFRVTVLQVYKECKLVWEHSFDQLCNFFVQFPLLTVFFLVSGSLLILVMKLSMTYTPNNMLGIRDFFFKLKRNILGRNVENVESQLEYNGDGLLIHNGNDANGTDSNLNRPDTNMEREPMPVPMIASTTNLLHLARRPLIRSRRNELSPEVSDDEMSTGRKYLLQQGTIQRLTPSCENNDNKLQKELADELDKQLCVVCQDRLKNITLLPCRHLCLCTPCSFALLSYNRPCPICRRVVTESLQVFL